MAMYLKTIAAWGALFFLCGGQTPQLHHAIPPATSDSPTQPNAPESLLRQSDRMGASFSPQDRAFQLFRMAEVASELHSDSSRKMVINWSNTLFRTARQMPREWNRGAFEKNAAELLSSADPDKAMDLLKQVDPPDLDSRPAPPEDLRSFGARTVFPRYWEAHGKGGLATLRSTAIEFGRNGEYPYPAIAAILNSLGVSDPDQTASDEIFRDALRYYELPTVIRSADRDFSEFVEERWTALDRFSKLAAVRAAVARLTAERPDDPMVKFAAIIPNQTGGERLDSERMLLLFQLLPKIREVDSEMAASIEKQYAIHNSSTGAESATASSFTVEDPDGTASIQSVNSALDQGLQSGILQNLLETSKTNPAAAFQLLPQLSEGQFRCQGMAYIAVALGASDPKGAESMLSSALMGADAIPADALARAKAYVTIANAAHNLKNAEVFHHALAAGLIAAREAISEDIDIHPSRPYYLAHGMDEASRLIQLQTHEEPDEAFATVTRLQDGELKAFLLVDLAEGLSH